MIERLDGDTLAAVLPELVWLLRDAVEHGASVSFVRPLPAEGAERFWSDVAAGVAAGRRIVLGARRDGALVGTVQLELAAVANGAHRAEVQKLLVHSTARRRGVASALMAAIEDVARTAGRTLLVLDTLRGDAAEPLYRALGWTEVGVIPDFAILSDAPRTYGDTIVFYKRL